MYADGKNQTRLTNNNFLDASPAFLPDGHHIVFITQKSMTEKLGIHIMDLLNP